MIVATTVPTTRPIYMLSPRVETGKLSSRNHYQKPCLSRYSVATSTSSTIPTMAWSTGTNGSGRPCLDLRLNIFVNHLSKLVHRFQACSLCRLRQMARMGHLNHPWIIRLLIEQSKIVPVRSASNRGPNENPCRGAEGQPGPRLTQ